MNRNASRNCFWDCYWGCTCQLLARLRAVSIFSWSVEQNARDTQMTTRVTEVARRERLFSSRAAALVSRISRLRRSTRARVLPFLNLKNKRDCSQSSYWLIFSLSLVTVPEDFANFYLFQFPFFSFLTWQIPSAENSFNNASITPVNT